MTDVTVACVRVDGHLGHLFTADYVARLRAMVGRHLRRPHRFVCLTDRPDQAPDGVEVVPVALPPGQKGWWAKVELFNPMWAPALRGRVLYLDLDVLVVAPLDAIVDYPARFALAPDGAPNFVPKDGTVAVHRFNSSVMAWDAGTAPDIHRAFDWSITRRLHGDQDWIGERHPEAATMPIEWFPRLSQLGAGPPFPRDTKVILAKKPKNAAAAVRWPWFAAAWG